MNKQFFKLLPIVLLGYGCFQNRVAGGTIALAPGDTLRIDFTSNPTATPCPSNSCDALALSLVLSSPEPPGVLATASLYNGATLLGITTGDPAVGLDFRSAASPFALGVIIDFSALQGPFNGSFYVTTTKTLSIDTTLTNVDLGHGINSGTFSYNPSTVGVSSIAAVPEPGYAGLLGVLLCSGAFRRFTRSRQTHRSANLNRSVRCIH